MSNGACCEFATVADCEHMERIFEERNQDFLKIEAQLEEMGTPDLLVELSPEVRQECLNSLEQGFEGTADELLTCAQENLAYAERSAQIESDLQGQGQDTETEAQHNRAKRNVSKERPKTAYEKIADKDFVVGASESQKMQVADHYNGKVPRLVRQALADPTMKLTRAQQRHVPEFVEDIRREMREQVRVGDGIDLERRAVKEAFHKQVQDSIDNVTVRDRGGSRPAHYKKAGHVMFERGVDKPEPGSGREKKVAELREKYPEGVSRNDQGFPDFSSYAKESVEIPNMVGDHKQDYIAARRAAGYEVDGSDQPKGYTWHHHEDGKTMQLVPTDLHEEHTHMGGVSASQDKELK